MQVVLRFMMGMLLIGQPLGYADTDREKERLTLLAEQLLQVMATAQRIQQEEAEEQYPRLEYAALLDDLARVRQGIRDYVNRVMDTTRQLEPVGGQYLGSANDDREDQ